MKKKAFTLMEMLIVVIIVGILAGTLTPKFGGARNKTIESAKIDYIRSSADELGIDDVYPEYNLYARSSSSSNGGGGVDTSDGVHYNGTDITVCREGNCITMQDKNLGASEAGTGTSSYGKHYQWGNNHGFLPCLESHLCETFPGGETTIKNERVDTTNYGPQNYFDRAVFSKITSSPYDWSTTRNDNLRGGANDSQANNRGYDTGTNAVIDAENRRGPCDEGYHVPSLGEWNQVLKYWAEENGIDLYGEDEEGLLYKLDFNQNFRQFQEDFKIPFVGRRDSSARVSSIGGFANLWSSSPFAGNERARYFSVDTYELSAFKNIKRAYALSLRCFKD